MKVQTKILLLLIVTVVTLVGGLVALKLSGERHFKDIADERAVERNRIFDEFLLDRGDRLKVLVEDSTIWDDLVRAIVKKDAVWTEQNMSDSMLATYQANAVWIYRPDWTLFDSRNNRYAENLRELPLPEEARQQLFSKERSCHFFLKVPQGWMEIRGGTIHPSRDRFRETTPQGYFFAGQIWIDENVRRMAQFTGYKIQISEFKDNKPQRASAEERGLITFSRAVPGWDGKPVAQIEVQHDSPIIRALIGASDQQFRWLMIFAGGLFLIFSTSLMLWVRHPLRVISKNLKKQNPEGLVPLQRQRNEFGELASLILEFRRTEAALHETEEQLRHSQKLEAVGRLAGGVAHDFNNLLTAIIGYAEMLELKLDGDGTAREHAQLIRQAGEQAAGLTRQLLAFSRKQVLQPKILDLNRLVLDLEKLLGRIIGEHIAIQIAPAKEELRVSADPTQVEQVIINLGINARDAMPRGGTLTITTSLMVISPEEIGTTGVDVGAGEYVALTVADTGSGMDPETKQRIFEPFFTTKGPSKGTGLGLATVYGIVRQSGGGIKVETELGKGSSFTIFLPRVMEPVEESEPVLPPITGSVNSERILVVEDEEVVRHLVCAVLSDAGYEVHCAATPREAIALVEAHPGDLDLLLTDVVLPEMNGPVLARVLAVRQPRMKVLFVSGYSESDISDQGVSDTGLEVLQKPFTQQVLIRKIRKMLDGPAANARPANEVDAAVTVGE